MVKVLDKLPGIIITIYSCLFLSNQHVVPLPSAATAIPPSQAIFAGSSPNITCVAEFDNTVDVPLILNIVLAGSDPVETDYLVQMESYMRYTRTFTIENIQESQEYTCAILSLYSELSPMYILVHHTDLMDSIIASVNVSISEYIVTYSENIMLCFYYPSCITGGDYNFLWQKHCWREVQSDMYSYDRWIIRNTKHFMGQC